MLKAFGSPLSIYLSPGNSRHPPKSRASLHAAAEHLGPDTEAPSQGAAQPSATAAATAAAPLVLMFNRDDSDPVFRAERGRVRTPRALRPPPD